VIKGDMSLVGPRPEYPDYVALYTPEQRRVLSVRPGVTSNASIAFSDEARLLAQTQVYESYVNCILPAKLAMELEYINRGPSLLDDMVVLFRTLGMAFRRRRRPTGAVKTWRL
jgi:lipopolysaccharide/colanic/teichoic acid biosynthesis glycosyltransferase